MDFNKHSGIADKHAFLSPSSHHWLNYDDQKLEARFWTVSSAARGTALHNLAHEAIRLGVDLDSNNNALALYVSDGIGFKMSCEVPLFYSRNCFGHADTMSFRQGKLRIHDLKTGVTATSEKQLKVYAAIFCLEYGHSPMDIEIELRIYQREDVRIYAPDPGDIFEIMERIVYADQRLEALRALDN